MYQGVNMHSLSAPKAGALPDCATPRTAEYIGLLVFLSNPRNTPKWTNRDKQGQRVPTKIPTLILFLIYSINGPNGDTP